MPTSMSTLPARPCTEARSCTARTYLWEHHRSYGAQLSTHLLPVWYALRTPTADARASRSSPTTHSAMTTPQHASLTNSPSQMCHHHPAASGDVDRTDSLAALRGVTVVLNEPVRCGRACSRSPGGDATADPRRLGNEVQGWLDAAPVIAARRARAWQLELDATIVNGFDSWVLTCSDGRGRRRIVMLIPDGRSARAQAETLVAWRRLGASRCVELVAFDRKDSAILLERVEPGGDGTILGDPSRATHEGPRS